MPRPKPSAPLDPAFVQALPYPGYIVDPDAKVCQANPRAETLATRLGLAAVLPDDVRRQVTDAIAKNQDTVGDDIRRAVHLSDGQSYLPQIFRLPGALGAKDGWAILLVDVTRFQHQVDAKTKALSMMSHEVKTPLTGIRMSLHLLLEEKLGSLNRDQRELLEVGRDECERMLVTLQALLELARLESGQTTVQLQPVAPADLLAETGAAHGEVVRKAGSELKIESPNGLPLVLADPSFVNRVLGSLLAHAARYGAKGRPIVLRAQPQGPDGVRFSVVNHGNQLSESEKKQMFDPSFRRSDGDSAGMGLNLALGREIALLHGGTLGVLCPTGTDVVEFFLDLRRAAANQAQATARACGSS